MRILILYKKEFEDEFDDATAITTNSADKPAELFPAECLRHCVLVSSQAVPPPTLLLPKQPPDHRHGAGRGYN
jgi:hypothetical protein